MLDFLCYKYKSKYLEDIYYNNDVKNKLLQLSKHPLDNLILYGNSGTCKKTLLKCYLNKVFNNDNSIYNNICSDFSLLNQYKIQYHYSNKHYEIKFLNNPKNNIHIVEDLIYELSQSKSVINDQTIIIIYDIHKLTKLSLIKNIIEKYHNVKILATSNKKLDYLLNFIQLRVSQISFFNMLKTVFIIKKNENLNIDNNNIIKLVDESKGNMNILLYYLQNILDDNNSPNLLNNIVNIITKKNIKDFPQIKTIINEILIFQTFTPEFIIDYLFSELSHLIKDKHKFLHNINNFIYNHKNNVINVSLLLDSYILYIYKMIK